MCFIPLLISTTLLSCQKDKAPSPRANPSKSSPAIAPKSSGKEALPFSGVYVTVGWLSNWKGSGDLQYANQQAELKGGRWSRSVLVLPDSTDTPVYWDGLQDSLVVKHLNGDWILWNRSSKTESRWIVVDSLGPIDFSSFNPDSKWISSGRIQLDAATLDRVAGLEHAGVRKLLAKDVGVLSVGELSKLMDPKSSAQLHRFADSYDYTSCDENLIFSETSALQSARVLPAQGQKRLYFHQQGNCPGGQEFCPTETFVIRNDQVLLAPNSGPMACALYAGSKGLTVGWLNVSELQYQKPLPLDSTRGRWKKDGLDLEISDGTYQTDFDLIFDSDHDPRNIHAEYREFFGPMGLVVTDSDCKMMLKHFEKNLVLRARGNCPAGLQGVYRKQSEE